MNEPTDATMAKKHLNCYDDQICLTSENVHLKNYVFFLFVFEGGGGGVKSLSKLVK